MNNKKTNAQQKTIREMASKKLLNGEQKRVLYKLFSAKLEKAYSSITDQLNKEEKTFIKNLIVKAKKDKTIGKLFKDILTAEKLVKRNETLLENKGFSIGGYKDNKSLTINTYHGDNRNKEFTNYYDKKGIKLEKVNDLKAKLLSDIYCLPYTAEEMTAYVNKEITKIINS